MRRVGEGLIDHRFELPLGDGQVVQIAQDALHAALESRESQPRPIAFDKVDRTIDKLPELRAAKPIYGLFLFGMNGEHRVWAVLDKSDAALEYYDVPLES